MPPDQGLCPWTPLWAPPPDPRYRLALAMCLGLSPPNLDFLVTSLTICKDIDSFWRSWRSKFGTKQCPAVIDNLCNEKDIADRFATVFQSVCVPNSVERHEQLCSKFYERFSQYTGDTMHDTIDVNLFNSAYMV